jgi:hypothetical protein
MAKKKETQNPALRRRSAFSKRTDHALIRPDRSHVNDTRVIPFLAKIIAVMYDAPMQFAKHFTDWLRIHPKALPLMGGFIVLLTFAVKDAWRDSVKDELSEIDGEISQFQFDQSLQDALGSLLFHGRTSVNNPVSRKEMLEDDSRLQDELGIDSTRLERIKTFEVRMGRDASDGNLKMLDATLTAAHGYERTLSTQLAHEPDKGQVSPEADKLSVIAFGQERLYTVRLGLVGLILANAANTVKRHDARVLRALSIASICLYVLGALIGIVGTVAGMQPKTVAA